jgi:hypothetical protein
MTPPQGSSPRPPRPKSASPAERSAEFADVQRRLKQDAAERRLKAAQRGADQRPARPTGGSRSHG